jgi:hypothetical protein
MVNTGCHSHQANVNEKKLLKSVIQMNRSQTTVSYSKIIYTRNSTRSCLVHGIPKKTQGRGSELNFTDPDRPA